MWRYRILGEFKVLNEIGVCALGRGVTGGGRLDREGKVFRRGKSEGQNKFQKHKGLRNS